MRASARGGIRGAMPRLVAVAAMVWLVGMPAGEVGAAEVSVAAQAPAPAEVPGIVPVPAEVPPTPTALADDPVLFGLITADGLRDDGTLPGALVEIRQGQRTRTVVADKEGRYRVEGLAPGDARVRVFHLAVEPLHLRIHLPDSGEVELDLELEPRVLSVAPLEVRGHRSLDEVARQTNGVTADGVAVRLKTLDGSTGMVESGLAGMLGSLPTEDEGPPDRVLFMRGSTVDARTVLLDGAPVLTPFHVGGLVSPFEAELVGDADLFLGGAPSRYGGGLSYLLDVVTRTPGRDRVGGNVSLDGLFAQGVVESPLPGGGGGMVGGRFLHGFQSNLDTGEFPYRYGDLLVRWGLPLAQGHRVDYTSYHNREGVRLDEILVDAAEASWGNTANSFRYTGLTERARISAVAAESSYDSYLPLEWEDPVMARGETEHRRLAVDLELPRSGVDLRFGVSADRVGYHYALEPRAGPQVTAVMEHPVELSLGWGAAYGEAMAPVGDRFWVEGGMRAQYFAGDHGLRLAPRASAHFLLTDDALLSASAGRYHEPIPIPGLVGHRTEDGADVLRWHPELPVASATHLVLALDQRLDDDLRLGVSGFVKSFQGIEATGLARVRSSGTDLRVSREGDRLQGWVGYALSWFWEEEVGSSSTFTGRHLVSAGVRTEFREGLEVGLTLGYGAGLPLSAVALAEPFRGEGVGASPDSEDARDSSSFPVHRLSTGGAPGVPLEVVREDDFLRLDLEASWRTRAQVGGRSTELRPYVRVLNALDRRDALFHYFDRWRDGDVQPVAERPFLPIVGVEWRF